MGTDGMGTDGMGFRGGEFSIFLELLFFWSGVAENTHQAKQRALRDSSMKINIIHID